VLVSLVSAVVAVVTVVAAVLPPLNPVRTAPTGEAPFPAPPGYLLPWAGGSIHTVTQGEETTFTHNGLAAYAFDFDMSYDTVVAARAGKVVLASDASNIGGCSSFFSNASNYVVIDHGDGTSALYLHLAYASVTVKPGELVQQGQPIGVSGETGFTCSDIDGGPGPHLHFQVQGSSESHYFTQSLPVAFDDIPRDNGVPEQGSSYVSGNFGQGKPQKIALTPYRVPRVFNPTARPADPDLVEALPVPVPTATPEAGAPGDAPPPLDPAAPDTAPSPIADAASATPEESETPRPTRTPTPSASPTATPEPAATDTPVPAPSDTPEPPSPEAPSPEPSSATTNAVTPPPTEPPATSEPSPGSGETPPP
jgi:murein DD-endopeptidase MepM/ murein hydrolase activator NlpD